ncbi:sulfite exporter TauE/SafE family protein [Leeia sp. TBRC 13508]|uniref:Probable membrane transporter protein n=1 Tax=Leeia speluncae TaxID=2884804 RepID=A0ABS8DAM5_9NEIS|nr:sulfite exporter TauE/SafE family protein [Leeia speluncae]MCB6185217.1 sulfite exporter TauE/SafE family protein [Leeia speluncae]
MIPQDPLFYWIAIPAVLITGISKGGFAGGLSMVSIPLMALVMPVSQAAAIMLPILCTADLFGWWSYRKSFDKKLLLQLMPGAIVGIAVGTMLFSHLDGHWLELLLGIMSILFAIHRMSGMAISDKSWMPEWLRAGWWSGLSGLTSFVAHAGGPPLMIYLFPKQMNRTMLVATMTFFFSSVNYIKLIPYAWLGQLDMSNLSTALVLAPFAPLGVYLGIWLHHRINEKLFYQLSYIFLILTGMKLIWDSGKLF